MEKKARISRISEIKQAKENAFLEGKERFRQSREGVSRLTNLEPTAQSYNTNLQFIEDDTKSDWITGIHSYSTSATDPVSFQLEKNTCDESMLDIFEEQYYHLIDCLQQTTCPEVLVHLLIREERFHIGNMTSKRPPYRIQLRQRFVHCCRRRGRGRHPRDHTGELSSAISLSGQGDGLSYPPMDMSAKGFTPSAQPNQLKDGEQLTIHSELSPSMEFDRPHAAIFPGRTPYAGYSRAPLVQHSNDIVNCDLTDMYAIGIPSPSMTYQCHRDSQSFNIVDTTIPTSVASHSTDTPNTQSNPPKSTDIL
ncbi:unnamed protein product [Echinostoma caproni]|uniref:TORC_N domain-containing protein n=1 Tax=Echinostoma caproni TaxID=27848 RepID=A0A183A9B6_9TREM|nr:unnamed protein product [Echinostoma caproni]